MPATASGVKAPTGHQNASTVLVVGCVSLALFLTSYIGNALTVAVPFFVGRYDCPPHLVTLAISGYATALACVLLPASIWARQRGNKRLFVYGLLGCALSTALTTLAPSVWLLFVGRLLQGASAALCLSTAMALIAAQVPAQQRFGAIGIAVGCTYVGVSTALSFSGIIIDSIGFEWMFYASATAFALLTLVARKLPQTPVHQHQRLPKTKSLFFALGIGLFLISLSTLSTQALAPYGLIVAVLLLALVASRDYAICQRHGLAQHAGPHATSVPKHPEVVIPVHFLRHNPAFLACFLVSVTAYFSVMAEPVLLALFSQFTLGLPASIVGFIVVVQPVTIALVSTLTGHLTRYLSGNAVVTLGLIIQTIALGSFVFIDENTTPLGLIVRQLFVGTGFALFSAPNTTLLTFAVGKANFALASSTQQVGRALGQASSLALVSLIIAAVVTAQPDSALYPVQFAEATVIILAISAISGLLGIAASGYGWYISRNKTHLSTACQDKTAVPEVTAAEATELVSVRAN